MPTQNRRNFIGAAIVSFLSQTYKEKELVIVDDGDDPVEDVVKKYQAKGTAIRYFRKKEKTTTGEKRNITNDLATGELICHFDDDDWSSPDRIEFQVGLMIKERKPIAGFSRLFFWDCVRLRALIFRSTTFGYVCGTSLIYRRDIWERNPFKNIQCRSDNEFVYPLANHIAASPDDRHMVARIHDEHTTPKTNITELIKRDRIPAEFWENENHRLEKR